MSANSVQIAGYIRHFLGQTKSGRRRLLAVTYRFEPGAFERHLLSVLGGHARADVIGGYPEDAERENTYQVWQANWRGTFHPKLLVVLADDRALAGLGSANLTSGGFGGNLEVWRFFDASDGQRSTTAVLAGVAHFLEKASEKGVITRRAELDEVLAVLPPAGEAGGSVLSSLDGDLLGQVRQTVNRSVDRLDIVSPINGEPTKLLQELRRGFGSPLISVYTDAKYRPPVPGVEYWTLKRPTPGKREDSSHPLESVHAKLYAFHRGPWVDLFWGSANLSSRAWLMSGPLSNVELLVQSRISGKEWERMLHRLPQGHTWLRAKSADQQIEPETYRPEGWRLLHAVWDGRLTIEASSGASRQVLLRSPDGHTVRIEFATHQMSKVLDRRQALRLGFPDRPPRYLEWKRVNASGWKRLPVNWDFQTSRDGEELSLAGALFREYAGRPMPSRQKANGPREPDGNRDPEERELTVSTHQGDLDRCVLEWRLVAKRIRASAGDNRSLWLQRTRSAVERLQREAELHPDEYAEPKRTFIRQLLEGMWQR